MRQLNLISDCTLFGLIAVAAIGCGANSTPTNSGTTPSPTAVTAKPEVNSDSKPSTTDSAEAKSIEIQEMDWDQLNELVASKKGKIVVVDLWSTSCEPCLREFPHLVAMQKQFKDDVVCISFNLDYIGVKSKPVKYYREAVANSLRSMHADSIVNVMSTEAAEDLMNKLGIGSIPAVCVYDQKGKLARQFDNRTPASSTEEGISYETQIQPLVGDLIHNEQ